MSDRWDGQAHASIEAPLGTASASPTAAQQIGVAAGPGGRTMEDNLARLRDRADDWSASAFWCEPRPSAPLAPMPDFAARTAELPNPRRSDQPS